jgi:hypothetical protein
VSTIFSYALYSNPQQFVNKMGHQISNGVQCGVEATNDRKLLCKMTQLPNVIGELGPSPNLRI